MTKNSITGLCLSSLLLSGSVLAQAEGCAEGPALDWLEGHWRADAEGTVFLENWSNENGQWTGDAESTSADGSERYMQETMTLEVRDGVWFYVVKVDSNEAPVAFALTTCEDNVLVFENKAHDFPQRIEYRPSSQDAFVANISDLEDKGFKLSFQRVVNEQ